MVCCQDRPVLMTVVIFAWLTLVFIIDWKVVHIEKTFWKTEESLNWPSFCFLGLKPEDWAYLGSSCKAEWRIPSCGCCDSWSRMSLPCRAWPFPCPSCCRGWGTVDWRRRLPKPPRLWQPQKQRTEMKIMYTRNVQITKTQFTNWWQI